MTTNPQDTITEDDLSLQTPKQRGVLVKLYPDTTLSSDWYEGEFSIRGGFAKSYLIGLGEMVELGGEHSCTWGCPWCPRVFHPV